MSKPRLWRGGNGVGAVPAAHRFGDCLGGTHAAPARLSGDASLVAASPRLVAARSRTARGHIAATPELLGAGTRLAQPRHGCPIGNGARCSAAPAKAAADRRRFCADLAETGV